MGVIMLKNLFSFTCCALFGSGVLGAAEVVDRSYYEALLSRGIVEEYAGESNPDLFSFHEMKYDFKELPEDAESYGATFDADSFSAHLRVNRGEENYFQSTEVYGEGDECKPIYKLKIKHVDVSRFKGYDEPQYDRKEYKWYRGTEKRCCVVLKQSCPYAFYPPLVVVETGDYMKVVKSKEFYGWRRSKVVIFCRVSVSKTRKFRLRVRAASKPHHGVVDSITIPF